VEIGERTPSEDLAGRCDGRWAQRACSPGSMTWPAAGTAVTRPGSPAGRSGSAPPRLSAGGSPC
jgi:hypothetical protein